MKLYILLPCYNEGEALPKLLASFQNFLKDKNWQYEIVVVNDGSIDNTVDAAVEWQQYLNIKILNHGINKGLGEAVNTGLSYFSCTCSKEDAAVVMDADNTHDPALIDSMLKKMKAGGDVVIASRYQEGGEEIGLSNLRKLFSAGANTLLFTFYGIPGVKDYTCGYRLYSARAIRKAYAAFSDNFIEEKGFTCMAEIIIKLHFLGCIIREVPLVLRYDMKQGKSKMKVAKTIKRYFYLLYSTRKYRQHHVPQPALVPGKQK